MYAIKIDRKILRAFMRNQKWEARDLVQKTGLSQAQACQLVNGQVKNGGPVTMGCLATLNIPNLFFLEKSGANAIEKIPIKIVVGEGAIDAAEVAETN